MFGFFEGVIENAVDVVGDFLEGDIDKRKIAKLLADGVDIAIVANLFNVTEDAIRGFMEDM